MDMTPPAFLIAAAAAGSMVLGLAPQPATAFQLPPFPTTSIGPAPPAFGQPHSALSRPSIPTAALSVSAPDPFGDKGRRAGVRNRSGGGGALRSSSPNGSDAVDAETSNSSPATASSSGSFLRAVDEFGMNLKPWALSAYEKSQRFSGASPASGVNGTDATSAATGGEGANRLKSFLYRIRANVLWILYIFYRGYRGFFVILPAVFREVYRQLEESNLSLDVFGDDDADGEREYAVNANAELRQQQQPMKLRTRITISVLSGMLTLSYVVSGAFRVLGKFIRTFTSTTSVESSFEAAADEVSVNEEKLRNKLK